MFCVCRANLVQNIRQCRNRRYHRLHSLATLMAASDEDQQNGKLACSCLLVLFLVAVTVTFVVAVTVSGPERLFGHALKLLPDDPGWNWGCGWTLFLCITSVLGLPIWSAACVLTGLMFGQRLSGDSKRWRP